MATIQTEKNTSSDTHTGESFKTLLPKLHQVEIKSDSVRYLGVELKKGRGGRLVPELSRFADNVITVDDLLLMQQVAIAWDLRQPILLEGGSGLGKTETIERMCAQLNRECYYANCHDFDAETIIGSKTVKEGTQTGFGWVDGVVIQAIRNGGILFLDEYNFMKGDTRGRLHEILDAFLRGKTRITLTENNSETVEVHPDFRLVAAQNQPGAEYGDREVLDPAQLTRFVYIKLPSEIAHPLRMARALGAIGRGGLPDVSDDQYLSSKNSLSRKQLRDIEGIDSLVEQFVEFTEDMEKETRERTLAADQPQPIYYSFQRDFNRVLQFVERYYDGNLNQTFHKALNFYYENRFESSSDKMKVHEHVRKIWYEPRKGPQQRIALGSEPDQKTRKEQIDAAFAERGMEFIDKQVKAGADLSVVVSGLNGIHTARAWDLRRQALSRPDLKLVSIGLTGDDSDEAWNWRHKTLTNNARFSLVSVSLAGMDSKPAWGMRDRLVNEEMDSATLIKSITALESDRAWNLRQEISSAFPNKSGNNMVLESLAGLKSDRAARLREHLAQSEVSYISYFRSLTGIETPDAMHFRRNNLLKNPGNMHLAAAISFSLAGLDSEEAWEIRDELATQLELPARFLVRSISGLDSERAWEMRERLADLTTDPVDLGSVCASVFGDEFLAAVRYAREDV